MKKYILLYGVLGISFLMAPPLMAAESAVLDMSRIKIDASSFDSQLVSIFRKRAQEYLKINTAKTGVEGLPESVRACGVKVQADLKTNTSKWSGCMEVLDPISPAGKFQATQSKSTALEMNKARLDSCKIVLGDFANVDETCLSKFADNHAKYFCAPKFPLEIAANSARSGIEDCRKLSRKLKSCESISNQEKKLNLEMAKLMNDQKRVSQNSSRATVGIFNYNASSIAVASQQLSRKQKDTQDHLMRLKMTINTENRKQAELGRSLFSIGSRKTASEEKIKTLKDRELYHEKQNLVSIESLIQGLTKRQSDSQAQVKTLANQIELEEKNLADINAAFSSVNSKNTRDKENIDLSAQKKIRDKIVLVGAQKKTNACP